LTQQEQHGAGLAALALGALGVVFGDIGTSPLYALQTVFSADNHAVRLHAGEPPVHRVPGAAIFLNPGRRTAPLAPRANVKHNHALQERVVILSMDTQRMPFVPATERVVVDDLGYGDDGIVHVSARFGYLEEPNVPAALDLACRGERSPELEGIDPGDVTYFVSRITILRTDAPGMARWRRKRFIAIAKNAASPVDPFRLPFDRTVTMGSHISV
jgi:KUP system potassium uptake protein